MYKLLFALIRLLSRMPLRVHYFLSDWLLFPLVFYVVRYRKHLVRRQLAECFPEKSDEERSEVERRFYHYFCDYIVETIKLVTIPHEEIRERVEFVGIPEMLQTLEERKKQFGFFYLGHYGNWEWMASFPMWLSPGWQGAQIYHPLYNKAIDRFFVDLRQQFKGICIPMKQTLRQILTTRKEGGKEIIGFIADQSPKWEAMHHWTDFLNHRTSFFIGTEKIGRQVDAALYYVRVTRPERGYYKAELVQIALSPDEMAEFSITDRYAALLEEQIRECPELWLWTHNRWKRTYEEWVQKKEGMSN